MLKLITKEKKTIGITQNATIQLSGYEHPDGLGVDMTFSESIEVDPEILEILTPKGFVAKLFINSVTRYRIGDTITRAEIELSVRLVHQFSICDRCKYRFGEFGINCAIHPYGNGEDCKDFEEEELRYAQPVRLTTYDRGLPRFEYQFSDEFTRSDSTAELPRRSLNNCLWRHPQQCPHVQSCDKTYQNCQSPEIYGGFPDA